MATLRTLARIEKLVWTLIFVGLLLVAIGYVTARAEPATGWTLMVAGAIAAAAGVVLIWVRSRLQAPAIDKQQGTRP